MGNFTSVDKIPSETIDLDSRGLVTLSNDLARAIFSLTKNELKLLLIAMAQMPKSLKNKNGDYEMQDYDIDAIARQPFYITKRDFMSLGVDSKNVAHDIRMACSDLMNKKVIVQSPFGEREINWTDSVLHFKSASFERLKRKYPDEKYDEEFLKSLKTHDLLDSLNFIANSEDNVIARVVFTRSIIPYICQLKEKFIEVSLSDLYGFNSFYSFRIYMLMMTYVSTGKIYIRLDDFRKMLGLLDSYKSLKDLRKNVLDIGTNEISVKSPYMVSYKLTDKTGRFGRGIKATNLEITFKKKSKSIDIECNKIEVTSVTTNNLTKEQESIIKANIDKYISDKKITDEKHKANIRKKAFAEQWGLDKKNKQIEDLNAQNAKVLAQIEAERKTKLAVDKKLAQEEAINKEFQSYYESLPDNEKSKIIEKARLEVGKIPMLIRKFDQDAQNAYKDVMFRSVFKKVMDFKNQDIIV